VSINTNKKSKIIHPNAHLTTKKPRLFSNRQSAGRYESNDEDQKIQLTQKLIYSLEEIEAEIEVIEAEEKATTEAKTL
jgi:hypothetical protein